MAVGDELQRFEIPIANRPPPTWSQTFRAVLFLVMFNMGCTIINSCHFLLLPLHLIPLRWTRDLYDEGIRYTKGSFASLLILVCQWFAPSILSVTFETKGRGRFTKEQIDQIVVRDKHGEVTELRLSKKFVFIGNHQMYADWWYAWCLAYFLRAEKDVFIVLKKSLKWLPIVGWGMQFLRFIFLARSWASDRIELARQLSRLGKHAQDKDKPFMFLLYPEGTLVSKDTRPISKKFADKQGIEDMKQTLLPRSTGLHHSLRSLAPRIPDLKLVDATVVYPGIPSMGYGQSYYTLRSIFFNGVSPPLIHVHLRMFDVKTEVPIGDVSGSDAAKLPQSSQSKTVETDIPEAEKTKFDEWLRDLWREKDESIEEYHATKRIGPGQELPAVEIPIRLRHNIEVLNAFCFFLPVVVVGYIWPQWSSFIA